MLKKFWRKKEKTSPEAAEAEAASAVVETEDKEKVSEQDVAALDEKIAAFKKESLEIRARINAAKEELYKDKLRASQRDVDDKDYAEKDLHFHALKDAYAAQYELNGENEETAEHLAKFSAFEYLREINKDLRKAGALETASLPKADVGLPIEEQIQHCKNRLAVQVAKLAAKNEGQGSCHDEEVGAEIRLLKGLYLKQNRYVLPEEAQQKVIDYYEGVISGAKALSKGMQHDSFVHKLMQQQQQENRTDKEVVVAQR